MDELGLEHSHHLLSSNSLPGQTLDQCLQLLRTEGYAFTLVNLRPVEFSLFQPPGTQPDAQSIMHQYFHAMATFITEQLSTMRFDVAKGSQHLSHGSIHTCTHIHRLGREPDFIDTDHLIKP